MLQIATWIREKDEAFFARFSSVHPEIRVCNARRGFVDPREADGLLVTGGPDIAAGFHLTPPRDVSRIQDAEPRRDAWEFAALRAALDRGLPLLCICKGVQALNIALGGTLHLDIPGHDLPEQRLGNIQPLRYDRSARLRFERVNSSHHQAIDRLAEALEVEAWSADDDIVEQVRVRDYPCGLGVQYHPERDVLYAPLFEEFFAAVKHGNARPT